MASTKRRVASMKYGATKTTRGMRGLARSGRVAAQPIGHRGVMEPFLVVFEMLGPVVTRGALRRAGEAGEAAERARTKAVVAANPTCRRPCSMRMPVSRKAEPTKRSIAAARSSTPLLQRQRAVGRPQPV